MSNLFSKAFFRTLNEADEAPMADVPQDPAAMSDADAMASTLDQGSAPEDFDVHSGSKEAAMAAAKSHAMMTDMLDNWIAKIAEFTEFINGATPNSVQTVLSKADKETLFGKIKAAALMDTCDIAHSRRMKGLGTTQSQKLRTALNGRAL